MVKLSSRKSITFVILLTAVIVFIYVLDFNPLEQDKKIQNSSQVGETTSTTESPRQESSSEAYETDVVLFNVPFTPQAPFGDWDDPRQQDGCEEASVLMAMRWVERDILTRQEALDEIIDLSKYQQETYGHFVDRSTADTAELIRDYYDYNNIEVKYDISSEDIKAELTKGNIIVLAMNGQKLNNPFYTSPGPLRHMLVVKGYDSSSEEFIANDPGTRRGEGFRYNEDVFENAIRDYPTGDHEPITEERKVMIVIKSKT